MHAKSTLLLGILLVGSLLAGCADEVPPVTIDADQEGVTAATSGNVAIVYQDAHSPANESTMGATGTVDETTDQDTSCAADEDPTGSSAEYQCTPAATVVNVSFESLPLPGTSAYKAFLVGNEGELELGDLAFNEHAEHMGGPMFAVNATLPENVNGMYDRVEVRLGSLVLAWAPATGGTNPFTVNPAVLAVSVSISYQGTQLTVNAENLPEGADPVGWLVEVDMDGEKVHAVQFPINGNATQFTAERPITEFAEFHVHVGDSKINMAIATLSTAADGSAEDESH